MKKIIIIAAALIGLHTSASAQSNASGNAQQSVQLGLSNALEITFTGNNSATGATVPLMFTSVSDYANGVESAAQQLKVRSNKNFNVTVKTATANFSVTNNGSTSTSSMPASALELKVSANGTGGTVASLYNNVYKDLSSAAASLITNGTSGGNQTFSVMYKGTPGYAYPAGTYAIDVIYTATQQ